MGYREGPTGAAVGVALGPCCEVQNIALTVGLVVGGGAPVLPVLPTGLEEVEEAPQVVRACVLVAVTAPLHPVFPYETWV